MKQRLFASLSFNAKKKAMRREVFLTQMGKVVRWLKLQALIEPHYPTDGCPNSSADPVSNRGESSLSK
jgi:transposase, IS5 family